jgi:gliding motility associated protien GldN
MKQLKKVFVILLLLSAGLSVKAQVLDRAYVKESNPFRKLIPYTYLREADVMWYHRVWRVIDLREKINFPLYYPKNEDMKDRSSLFKVIKKAALLPERTPGRLVVYSKENDDDEFNVELNQVQVVHELVKVDTIQVNSVQSDPNSPMVSKMTRDTLASEKISQYWLKEDWFFDKQKSVLECRIIGIMPIQLKESGGSIGLAGTFWIYFPALRPLMAKEDVFNRHNDAERMTFDDLFWKRQFSGYVQKENNVYDRYIAKYKTNTLEQLLEAERIKTGIFTLEHDLWHL